jgi:hypothetical protein
LVNTANLPFTTYQSNVSGRNMYVIGWIVSLKDGIKVSAGWFLPGNSRKEFVVNFIQVLAEFNPWKL